MLVVVRIGGHDIGVVLGGIHLVGGDVETRGGGVVVVVVVDCTVTWSDDEGHKVSGPW